MQRRDFMCASTGALLGTLLPACALPTNNTKNATLPIEKIKPQKLKSGDTVGLIAPGFAITQEKLKETINNIKALGLVPFYTDRIIGNYGYLSNSDEERLADLHEHFSNPNIKGIICARGGYGCTRILADIDYQLIKNNPKVLIGFSDITALLNAICQRTGLVAFHGPVGATLNPQYSVTHFKEILMSAKATHTISLCEEDTEKVDTDPAFERYTITPGVVKGELCGGNLSLLTAMAGTPDTVDFTNKIVVIEDVGEKPYRIDRMLTQLIENKTFTKAKAILLGVFYDCNPAGTTRNFTLKEVILDRILPLGLPAAYGFSFGHIDNNATLPFGSMVEVDTKNLTITLLEKSVV